MALKSVAAPPSRMRELPEAVQRQFDYFYEWILRLNTGPQTGSVRFTSNGKGIWTDAPTDINRVLVWDPTTDAWAPRNNRVVPFDAKYGPTARWGLNVQSLADSGPNSFNLTVENGTERWTYITPTMGGFLLDGATNLIYTSASDLLGPTGDMTFLCDGIFERPAATASFIAGYDDVSADADPNNNTRWSIFLETNNAITFISESGAGVNATHQVNSFAAPHQFCQFGFTRISGVVQFYLNGRVWGAPSAALTTPTGGSSSRLRFGARETAASPTIGVLASAAIYPRGLTSAEIVERWNYTAGIYGGFITLTE